MDKFTINQNISFAIDTKGVAISDRENHQSEFLTYPEAGIWLVLSEGFSPSKSIRMLETILGKDKSETESFVIQCLGNWRNKGYIY